MSKKNDTTNRGGYYAFVGSFAFSIIFCLYLALFYSGVDLKEIPTETEITQTLAASGFDPSLVAEPQNFSPEMIAHGKKLYKSNCALCHGSQGKGDGPGGKSLNPPPRDLVQGQWKKGGTSKALYLTIQKGMAGTSMASFAHLAKNDRWALVHFIRSITKNKIKDNKDKLEAFSKTAK